MCVRMHIYTHTHMCIFIDMNIYVCMYTQRINDQNFYQFKTRACISMQSRRGHSRNHRRCHEFKRASMSHGVQNEAEVPVIRELFDF